MKTDVKKSVKFQNNPKIINKRVTNIISEVKDLVKALEFFSIA